MTITAIVFFYDKPSEEVTISGTNEESIKNEINSYVNTLQGVHSTQFQQPIKDNSVQFLKDMFNMT